MKGKRKPVSYKTKDVRIIQVSVILVILVFWVQCFIIYRLYSSDTDLLQRELNLSVDEIYQADLNRRLAAESDRLLNTAHTGYELSAKVDSLSLAIPNKEANYSEKHKAFPARNIEIEEYINKTKPINLNKIDSIATLILTKNNINLNFYCEIIDIKSEHILSAGMSGSKDSPATMYSKNIPLNAENTKALRIVLINPVNRIYKEMGGMLITTLILSTIIIYSFYRQRVALSDQKKLIEVKNDLFADIFHEMKKPLSLISHAIDSFEHEDILFDTTKRTRNLKLVKSEIDWMSNHTNMVLSLAMEDQGVFELNCTEFDLGELVSNLADKYSYTSSKFVNIEILNELSSPFVYADPDHMEHMLSNLITNSIKYSRELIIIVIKLRNEGEDVVISIKDNGAGISKEQQAHIFEKYYRVGALPDVKGHGIGLNYVKRIVEKHKGEIRLVSELDKGSEFTIRLPQPAIKKL